MIQTQTMPTDKADNAGGPLRRAGVAACAMFALALGPTLAQDDESEDAPAVDQAQEEEERGAQTMSLAVSDRLQSVQTCLALPDEEIEAETDRTDCALEELERLRNMRGLSPYELAQMWKGYGFVYYTMDDLPNALDAFLNGLEQPDLDLGLEEEFLYTASQLHRALEQHEEALELLLRWFDLVNRVVEIEPGSQDYFTLSALYYELDRYEEAIEPLETAIELREGDEGEEPNEPWYQLWYTLYYELGDLVNTERVLKRTVQLFPSWDNFQLLAGVYLELDPPRQMSALALFHTAHEVGWLESNAEYTSLGSMLTSEQAFYLAGKVVQEGLDNGIIEETEQNWRMLANAWQNAQEDELALPAFAEAGALSDEGEIELRLAQSMENLFRWEECVDAAEQAIEKGGLNRMDQANLLLGRCLVENRQWDAARAAFRVAARDERSRESADDWLTYVDSEEERQSILASARAGD